MLQTIVIAIAVILAVAIAVVLAIAASKPDSFRIQRAITIKAPPDKVFALIDDFHRWGSWSPYEKKDLAMTRTFSGADAGKGAVYEWNGDKNVGNGRMEIMQSSPSSQVIIKLDFFSPFEAHNIAEFTTTKNGEATDVVWAMHGPAPFMTKIFHVFLNIDRMVGKDFEDGLVNMKAVAEAAR